MSATECKHERNHECPATMSESQCLSGTHPKALLVIKTRVRNCERKFARIQNHSLHHHILQLEDVDQRECAVQIPWLHLCHLLAIL